MGGRYPAIETLRLSEEHFATGDINNDGTDDAVVIVVQNGGGSGFFYFLAAVLHQRGCLVHVATRAIDDRPVINMISVQNGIITLDAVVHKDPGGACCPTLHRIMQYKLSGHTLVEQ